MFSDDKHPATLFRDAPQPPVSGTESCVVRISRKSKSLYSMSNSIIVTILRPHNHNPIVLSTGLQHTIPQSSLQMELILVR